MPTWRAVWWLRRGPLRDLATARRAAPRWRRACPRWSVRRGVPTGFERCACYLSVVDAHEIPFAGHPAVSKTPTGGAIPCTRDAGVCPRAARMVRVARGARWWPSERAHDDHDRVLRSEEHTSELQSHVNL